SDGTTSVSYAVIQLLKQQSTENKTLNICLLGLGKMGLLTLKNLKAYLPQHNITVINRNETKARETAVKFGVNYAPNEAQTQIISQSDIIIAATGADHAIIDRNQIENSCVKLIFDLSVPSNVSPEVKAIPSLKLYDIDQLSQYVNSTLSQRKKQIPAALEII